MLGHPQGRQECAASDVICRSAMLRKTRNCQIACRAPIGLLALTGTVRTDGPSTAKCFRLTIPGQVCLAVQRQQGTQRQSGQVPPCDTVEIWACSCLVHHLIKFAVYPLCGLYGWHPEVFSNVDSKAHLPEYAQDRLRKSVGQGPQKAVKTGKVHSPICTFLLVTKSRIPSTQSNIAVGGMMEPELGIVPALFVFSHICRQPARFELNRSARHILALCRPQRRAFFLEN